LGFLGNDSRGRPAPQPARRHCPPTIRTLIGDDERSWSLKGVLKFADGCYAKVINLSPVQEPEVYANSMNRCLVPSPASP
jgi:hypothetical protein